MLRVVWNVGEFAQAVAELPTVGRLPTRTVVVPNGRLAHSIRRLLVVGSRASALNGTRFSTAAALAFEMLETAHVSFRSGEERLRPARLGALFRQDLPLRYFERMLLRDAAGWDEAFAQTIGDLEDAGFSSESFSEVAADDRESDVARIWERLDAAAGDSWTDARVIREATARSHDVATPVLVVCTGDESAAAVSFLRRIRDVTAILLGARPVSHAFIQKQLGLWRMQAGIATEGAEAPRLKGSRCAVLASGIFDGADHRQPTTPIASSDHSVVLEEHAGVDAELDAAVDWIGREVFEKRTPLGDIAVLLPEPDPLASLLVARIARLPWPDAEPPVYVAGGLPLSFLADGAHALAILRALAEGLPAEQLLAILPTLRTAASPDPEPSPPWPVRLSRDQALQVLVCIGALGHSVVETAVIDDGIRRRTVRDRLHERITELAASTALPPATVRGTEISEANSRLLGLLYGIRDALSVLLAIAERIQQAAPITEVEPAIRRFLAEYLFTPTGPRPPGGKRQPDVGVRLAPAFGDLVSAGSDLRGADAVRALDAAARRVRVPFGLYGSQRIYVGTIRDAIGTPFRSVRIVGLCDGAFPRGRREDPILPDSRRRRVSAAISLASDRASADARSLHRVLLEASRFQDGCVVLSMPRVDIDGTTHEPSSLFLDAAGTLRPGRVPDLGSLRTGFFRPARARATATRLAEPLDEGARLDRAAHKRIVPLEWSDDPSTDLQRIASLQAGPPVPDGLLDETTLPVLRGLAPERPISASDLRTLLECPRHFLEARVLRRRAPGRLPGVREVAAIDYGTLYHRSLERFFRTYGDAFFLREQALPRKDQLPPYWEDRGRAGARDELSDFARWYPLDESARDSTERRLSNAVASFLRHEWQQAPRRPEGAEREFGYDRPLSLEFLGHRLFVRGAIDRIDREHETTFVRDFKTGIPHARLDGSDPSLQFDLQLALYLLVARELAGEWKLPGRVEAAYSYTAPWGIRERRYRLDADRLAESGGLWLSIAASLLRGRAFPRTPNPDDCSFCAFGPSCGAGAQRRARILLETPPAAFAAFAALKLPPAGTP